MEVLTQPDTEQKAAHSSELFERAKKIIPGGVNSPVRAFRSVGGTPFFTRKVSGAKLTAHDGREFIDYVCTWGPAIHGHNNPEIANALQNALFNGVSFGTPCPDEVTMAEWITDLIPSVEQVRLCNSGTEATMSAIRLARGYTKRNKIIKFSGCYHGHVDSLLVQAGSGAVTFGNPDSAGIPKAFTDETIVLPLNDVSAIEEAFEKFGQDIAGVILEPYPANTGLILPKPGFLKSLATICQKHQALLIFDEVMTGFRVGFSGVQGLENITPDLTTLGKVIGGGLPVGALGGRRKIMEYLAPVGPVYQAGTLSGNPLSVAAGIASLTLLKETTPFESLNQKSRFLKAIIAQAAKEKGIAVQIPQVGSMFCVFFSETPITNFAEAQASDISQFKKFFHNCLSEGVYLPPSAFETYFLSTAHSEEILQKTAEVFTKAIKAL